MTCRIGRCLLAACVVYATASIEAQHRGSGAAFHHIHLNVLDPAASVAFYTNTFETTRRRVVGGWDGVQSDDVHLLFERVSRPASTALETAIWHVGWVSPDIPAFAEKTRASGVVFERASPALARLNAIDGNPIEINSEYLHLTPHPKAFSHIHMFSAAPYCAGDWYQKILGATLIEGPDHEKVLGKALAAGIVPRKADCRAPYSQSGPDGRVDHPNALLKLGGVYLLIYPQQSPEYLNAQWAGRRPAGRSLVSTRGHVIDHFAVSYPDVLKELNRLKAMKVRVIEDLHPFGTTSLKAAMIEGPDSIAVELVGG